MSTTSDPMTTDIPGTTPWSLPEHVSSSIKAALTGIKFGQITIMVHDGEVVQIDRILRTRPYRNTRPGQGE